MITSLFNALILAIKLLTNVVSDPISDVPEPVTTAEPVTDPTIAVTDPEPLVVDGITVAGVVNFPAVVVLVDGATTVPLEAASVTEVPSDTGYPFASTTSTFAAVAVAVTVTFEASPAQKTEIVFELTHAPAEFLPHAVIVSFSALVPHVMYAALAP